MKTLYAVLFSCLLCCSFSAQAAPCRDERLQVLILGGTNFLGPHLTRELLNRGHRVTHFNRGNPSEFSFPEVETLKGDRQGDLTALEGRVWDAVIDTSGYFPRVVDASSKILSQATSHYTFISTISVYADFSQCAIDERSPIATLDDEYEEIITDKTYGPLKAGCEKVIASYFPENSLIVRPGLIVGPYDHTDRFTYWVRRVSEGGYVLVPDSPKQKLQFIDARDLSSWIVTMIEDGVTGIFNATGMEENLDFETFLQACARFSKKKVKIVWVDEEFIIDNHLDNWHKFPFWLSRHWNMDGLFHIDSSKAVDCGLSYRPFSDTVSDTLRWDEQRVDRTLKVGCTPEEEKEILNAMRNNHKIMEGMASHETSAG